MNKTLKTILISIFILILFFIVFIFFALRKQNPAEGSIEQKIQNIFPFGNTLNTDSGFPNGENIGENGGADGATGTSTSTDMVKEIPVLRKISENPTAGSTIISREVEELIGEKKTKIKKYFVRFVDRSTGHVFETPIDSFDVTKISNTTLPKMYEATFDSTGNSFIARFLDEENTETIKTYSVFLKDTKQTASTSTTTKDLGLSFTQKEATGTYLETDIREYSLFPSKNKLSYLVFKNDGGSVITSTLLGQNKKEVLFSKLREWLLETESETKILLTTKPSGRVPGFAYSLNTLNGSLTKVFGGIVGLTVKPLVGTDSYLLGTGGNTTRTFVEKNPKRTISVPLFSTLPEKCVQGKKDIFTVYCAVPRNFPLGIYPDSWYSGEVSFNDSIWQADIKTNKTSFVNSPFASVKENLDAINLQVSPDDNYLTFINKKDLSLWGLLLKKQVIATTTTSSLNTASSTSSTTKQ